MAVADGRIEAGSLFLGSPPVKKDFRRSGARDELDRVMVEQLERLLSPYRDGRPRALDLGSPQARQWANVRDLSAGQLGGARIALADWAAAQDPPVQYVRAVGVTKAAKLADLLAGLAAATVDGGGGHQQRRPVDGVELEDVLAEDLDSWRPLTSEVRIPGHSEIVTQGVNPDIDCLILVSRHRHAPV